MAQQLVRITGSKSQDFERAWMIYEEALPEGERKSREAIEALLGREDYRIYGLREAGRLVAFAIFFLSAGGQFALLEYMASDRKRRNRGLGAALFRMGAAEIGSRTILVEVDSDRAAADDGATRTRRKAFYRRLGCRPVEGMDYIMPMVAGVPPPTMDLLVRPGPAGGPGAKACLRAWLEEIYADVYGQALPDSRIDAMLEGVTDPVTYEEGPRIAGNPKSVADSGNRLIDHWRRHPLAWGAVALVVVLLAIVLPYVLRWPKLSISNGFEIQYSDLIAIYALLVTVLIAVYSVIPNLDSIARSSRFTHYAELDSMYFEILRLGLAEPYLRNPGTDWRAMGDARREKYEIYALIVWNFIETIRDRCVEDEELKWTWAPAMIVESRIHKAWFRDLADSGACLSPYREAFRQFVRDNLEDKDLEHLMKVSWAYEPA